jgi:hypothetical protein
MNARFVSVLLVSLLPLGTMACASSESSEPAASEQAVSRQRSNDLLLANVFMRQIVTGHLLPSESNAPSANDFNYELLRLALEGPGDGKFAARVLTLRCERGLGTDTCEILINHDVVESGEEETESTWKLNVRVFEGRIINANVELFAG